MWRHVVRNGHEMNTFSSINAAVRIGSTLAVSD